MLLVATRTGDRRNGRIAITADGLTYGYAYHRGTGRARHDLTVYPSGGALAAPPRLSDLLFAVAEECAEARDDWPMTIEATETLDGWTMEARAA